MTGVRPSGAPDAASLAEVVVGALPRRTFGRRFGGYRVPARITDACDELCPRCGRRLACSLGPLGAADGIVIPRSRRELLGACLVDGGRHVHSREFAPETLVAAACVIADGLDERRWNPWANAIRHSLAGAWEWWPPVEAAGQALEAVRAFGPLASELDQPPETRAAHDALEVLVTSSGPFWLDCRTLRGQRLRR